MNNRRQFGSDHTHIMLPTSLRMSTLFLLIWVSWRPLHTYAGVSFVAATTTTDISAVDRATDNISSDTDVRTTCESCETDKIKTATEPPRAHHLSTETPRTTIPALPLFTTSGEKDAENENMTDVQNRFLLEGDGSSSRPVNEPSVEFRSAESAQIPIKIEKIPPATLQSNGYPVSVSATSIAKTRVSHENFGGNVSYYNGNLVEISENPHGVGVDNDVDTTSYENERSNTEFDYGSYSDYGENENGPNSDDSNNSEYNHDECHPVQENVTATRAVVAWSSVWSCRVPAVWLFLPPPDHAVTIKIEKLFVTDEYSLKIYAEIKTDLASSFSVIRQYDKSSYDSLFLPFLTDKGSVRLEIAPGKFGSCSFNITYYAHPIESIPTLAVVNFQEPTDSLFKFNCANLTRMPEVLRCDLVRQCVGGEDEVRCPYQEDGACGDWVPYGDKCLKVEFVRLAGMIPGHSTPTMPLQAMKQCRTKYGATLARLPDDRGVTLLAGMIGNAGFQSATIGLKKMKPVSLGLRHLYRFIWQWGDRGDPVAHEQMKIQRRGPLHDCAMLSVGQEGEVVPLACSLPRTIPDGYACMRQRSSPTQPHASVAALEKIFVSEPLNYVFLPTNTAVDQFPTKHCQDGSRVQTFHRCSWEDFELETTNTERSESKSASKRSISGVYPATESNLPVFQCQFGQSIHYTLVCDGHDDCPDKSDELFCQIPRLPTLSDATFSCRGSQIIPASFRCDGNPDCFDERDEEDCSYCMRGVMCAGLGCLPTYYALFLPDSCPMVPLSYVPMHSALPASLNMDGRGMSTFAPTAMCSPGEFECFNGLCIPAFLVNNGEQDCPHGEDEHIPKENVTCPGYYRCHSVGLCVPAKYVCDGVYHCPNKDDERYCDLSCPTNCSCEGHAYTCTAMFDPVHHLHVRYLDLNGATGPTLSNISVMEYLHFLNLSSCQLKNIALSDLPHLIILDLSFNALEGISAFFLEKLSRLDWLDLSGNPLVNTLDASFTSLLTLAEVSELHTLIITNTQLTSISDGIFAPLSELRTLDLRGNGLTDFDDGVFSGLRALAKVYADNYKLCCPYFHPSPIDCLAPQDELSSCSDLLRVDFFRVFLWAFSLLAIAGNGGSLVYRLCYQKLRGPQQCSRILVANLCLADLLMGVYMMIVGAADTHYRGVYVSMEGEWRGSVLCKMAGFLAFVSCEVSAFAICLVTLDRFLILCFPLKSNLHMTSCSALMACGASWVVGVVLASVPLVAQWEFYGQNGICLPLPITRLEYQGQEFAFAVFIVLNFVLFLVVGAGQVVIFQSVRSTGSKLGSERSKREVTVARRLFLIVLTDFLCWFPIGLMGLLASQGTPVPGEVNVWAATFVVPLNAALNPFLYTINSLRERWARREEEKRMKKTIGKLHSLVPKWSPANVAELTRICILSRLVNPQLVLQWLGKAPVTERNEHDLSQIDIDLKGKPFSTDAAECSTCYTQVENI